MNSGEGGEIEGGGALAPVHKFGAATPVAFAATATFNHSILEAASCAASIEMAIVPSRTPHTAIRIVIFEERAPGSKCRIAAATRSSLLRVGDAMPVVASHTL